VHSQDSWFTSWGNPDPWCMARPMPTGSDSPRLLPWGTGCDLRLLLLTYRLRVWQHHSNRSRFDQASVWSVSGQPTREVKEFDIRWRVIEESLNLQEGCEELQGVGHELCLEEIDFLLSHVLSSFKALR
jgi:hypothetical protein